MAKKTPNCKTFKDDFLSNIRCSSREFNFGNFKFSILREFDLTLMKIGKRSFIFILMLQLLSPFSLIKLSYAPKVTIIKRATKTCNLFCNIAAKLSDVAPFYHPHSNLSGNKSGCCQCRIQTFREGWGRAHQAPPLDLPLVAGWEKL